MDTLRLRTAAGDAARAAQSVLRSAAANPERLTSELADYRVLELAALTAATHNPDSLRAVAREHILMAVAYMDAARQQEGGGQ